MSKERIILIIIFILLLSGNVFFGFRCFQAEKRIKKLQESLSIQRINQKALDFTKLFIDKVLNAKGEVSFETRLKLENAIREIKDKEILKKWEDFTTSQSEEEAQENVKELLKMLINKIGE